MALGTGAVCGRLHHVGSLLGSEQSREKRKWRRQGRSLLRGAAVVGCLSVRVSVCSSSAPLERRTLVPTTTGTESTAGVVGTGTLLMAKQERTERAGAGGEGLGDLEEEDHGPVGSVKWRFPGTAGVIIQAGVTSSGNEERTRKADSCEWQRRKSRGLS